MNFNVFIMSYNDRPKINPKIIFNNVDSNIDNALIIGNNNSDIVEILKSKKIDVEEFQNNKEKEILDFLNSKENNKYNVIIFNFELSNFHRLRIIINALLAKSNYCIIRFRNHNVSNTKITKKDRIYKIINIEKINVLKKFYSKKNFVSKSILFKPFSYYTVYFITKDKPALNFELSFIGKIKKILLSLKRSEKLVINKK